MFKNGKYFCLIFLLTFFLLNSRISLAVELTGKEPKVDDFNKERKVPPPIDQPNLLKKPQDDQKSTSDIKIKISQFNFTGNTVISNEQLKDLDKFYEIHLKIKKKEFDRKIRATYTKNFKPFIYLYKKEKPRRSEAFPIRF